MGLLSKLADSTPGVGHIKGIYHYSRGEKEKGDNAMYQSTRTSAVILGGIAGGPVGAISAGVVTDAAASALTKDEKGFIDSCKNIAEDLAEKRNPTRSIASASLQMGIDGICGFVGSPSGVSSASNSAISKTIQTGGKQIIQKSVKISSAEAAKFVGRKTTETIATQATQKAFLIYSHIGLTAAQRKDHEKYEQSERELEESERRREWIRREREWKEREQRKWRESEQRDRERREREQQEQEWREREQREEEWRDREWREQELIEREWREQKRIEFRKRRVKELSERKQKEKKQLKIEKQEECRKSEQRANSENQQTTTSGLNSNSAQAPQDDEDKNVKGDEKNEPSIFEKFMTLLKRILKKVYGNESEPFTAIFENLSKENKKYLLKVLRPIMKFGTLDAVLELVIKLFKQHFTNDISFGVILSLLEFVQAYIADELLERTLISSGTETSETKMKPNERRETIIANILNETDIIDKLISLFEKMKNEIEAENMTVFPNFRDIFAAVHHCFKHRRVPPDGRLISIKEYYKWIRKLFDECKTTQEYSELKAAKVQSYVYETFVPIFCRRFKIVLKLDGNKIVLSSAYVIDMINPDDEKLLVSIVCEILTVIFIVIGLPYILKGIFPGSK